MEYKCDYFRIGASIIDDVDYLYYCDRWPRFTTYSLQIWKLFVYLHLKK